MTAPTASVVICCHESGRWDLIARSIESVLEQTVEPSSIVVVVDHNPVLFDKLESLGLPIEVVENRYDQGLSGARNTGVERSSGDVVAFLDDDAAANPGWLEKVLDAHSRPGVIGVGGGVVPEWEGDRRPEFLSAEFDWVVGCSYRGLPRSGHPIRNPIGANMSMRRDVFDAVGGFRADLGRVGRKPLGCEETDLAIRASALGRFVHVPEASVVHRVPSWRQTPRYFVSRCFHEGRSKARLRGSAGSDALSSEWRYVLAVLPLGFLRSLGRGVRRFDASELKKAFSMILGVFAAAAGYLAESVALVNNRRFATRDAQREDVNG